MNINGAVAGDRASELEARLGEIQSRDQLVSFVRLLLADLRNNPGGWENGDLASFLEGLAAWTDEMDGYFKNRNEAIPESPSWKILGQMLLAARVYE